MLVEECVDTADEILYILWSGHAMFFFRIANKRHVLSELSKSIEFHLHFG